MECGLQGFKLSHLDSQTLYGDLLHGHHPFRVNVHSHEIHLVQSLHWACAGGWLV